jgi:drug/metabolite transporter (DMT)-like permease
VVLLTVLAMVAFAGNSLLCRIALREQAIDASSFTTIRLASGAAALWLLVRMRGGGAAGRGSWASAFALFAYAIGFSFAYGMLAAGTGALLLFGAIQVAMIGWGVRRGERLRALQLVGLASAFAGLVGLMLPGASAPSFAGSVLMLGAGLAWAAYSVRGQAAGDPLRVTAGNFLRAAPIALAASLPAMGHLSADTLGIACAVTSGALTSGIGYAIWYTALPLLRTSTAATVQLSVPCIVAVGGVLFLGEPLTARLVIASVAIVGGIALVISGKKPS